MKIAVIANPRSGANRRRPQRIARLTAQLSGHGPLLAPPDLGTLQQDLARLRAEGIEVLGICGGDGTLHQVMTALIAAYGEAPLPRIALLKGGTMNTIARDVGVRARAAVLLGRILSGEDLPTVQRTLLITDEQRAGFIFGNAGIAHFLEAYYAGGAGPVTGLRVLLRCFLSALVGGPYITALLRKRQMSLTLDGEPLAADRFTALGVATVSDLGFGFRPFYAAPGNLGKLHLIGIGCTPIQFAAAVPAIRLARPIGREDVVDRLARTITLTSAEPLSYTIDGDLYPPRQSLTLRAGPLVRFIVG